MSCRRGGAFWAAVICAALGAHSAVAQDHGLPLAIPDDVAAALSERSPRSIDDLRLIQSQVQRVVERTQPATVAVQVGPAVGSGVIISEDGLVLTVAHVIGRAGRRARITLPDGRRLTGRSLGANHGGDAGMVQLVNPPSDLPYAPIAGQERLELGEWVITSGHPGGVIRGRSPPIRLGRVLNNQGQYVQTDCALVGGDSGGPLFNMRGEVVGIHSSIAALMTQNFHVPVSTFRNNWDRLLAGEVWGREEEDEQERAFYPLLGVAGRTADGKCLITEVWPELPADEAGLQRGDVVIAVNGETIDSFDGLAAFVHSQRPGRRITLSVVRGDETLEKRVRLAGIDRPLPGAADPPQRQRDRPGAERSESPDAPDGD